MKTHLLIKKLLIVCWFAMSTVHADVYLELSSGMIVVDSPTETTRPILADFRLGYEKPGYQFELALMTSVKDGEVNQLTIGVPFIASVLFHYIPETLSSLKVHYILGASQVEVDSSYPGVADSSENFYGVSYGLGLEEHFKSIPQLKISFDFMQLYRGDQLDLYTASLGFHYEF